MATHRSQTFSCFLALPSELTELTLIYSAALGFPTAIACIAQTCRTMRTLVYGASDQHLWREVFLTTFDDPRIAEAAEEYDCPGPSGDGETGPSERDEREKGFDWGAAFRQRVWAENYIRRATSSRCTGTPPAAAASNEVIESANAIESVLSVIGTALPFPPTLVFSFLPPNPSLTGPSISSVAAQPAYPIFPPLPASYLPPNQSTGTSSDNAASGASTCTPGKTYECTCNAASSIGQSYTTSLNIRWLEKLLARGFPPALTTRIAGDSLVGGSQAIWDDPEEARAMRMFGRLMSSTGFLAVPQDESKKDEKKTPEGGQNEDSHTESVDIQGEAGPSFSTEEVYAEHPEASPPTRPVTPASVSTGTQTEETRTSYEQDSSADHKKHSDMSVAAQERRARRIARMRVYNMRYLSRERHWGPYLLPASATAPASASFQSSRDFLRPILALFADHDAGHPNHNAHADADAEPDFVIPMLDDSDSDDMPLPAPQVPPFAGSSVLPPLPGPKDLRADWVYLAAVRVVVEANLRDAVDKEELSGLLWLDGLRRGSAPAGTGFGGDITEKERGVEEGSAMRWKGKAKAEMEEEVDGWDWAGVSGVWRRCVSWMDYRDLIQHNLTSNFDDPALQEAVRIVPMRLRVAGYSPSTVPAYPDRPTIHVMGETAGPAGSSSIRQVRGTVDVIADGNIRWNLYSSISDNGPDEWVTEGIQVGNVRSGMGVLGMWTGALHERMDPLGPFWAWKVG